MILIKACFAHGSGGKKGQASWVSDGDDEDDNATIASGGGGSSILPQFSHTGEERHADWSV